MCIDPILDSRDAPRATARRVNWIEGERLAFGFFEAPGGYDEPAMNAARETFLYVLSGKLDAETDGERKTVGAADIVHIPRGKSYRLQVKSAFARYVTVCSTPRLEQRIDNMTPEEAEQARVNLKPN